MYKTLHKILHIGRLLRIRLKIVFYYFTGKDIKLIIGSGGISQSGWISTDINTLNIINDHDWKKLLPPSSVSVILAEHVFEHLSFDEASKAFENCFHYLKYSGCIRIAVPDGLNPSEEYIKNVMPGGTGAGAMDHKVLYDYHKLAKLLESQGFIVNLLEYYDEDGIFRFREWDPETGVITRSKRYDPRNQRGELLYTSLIADAVKTAMR